MKNLEIVKVFKRFKGMFRKPILQKGDIVLATFPKSGTTWFRFIWYNIVSIIELDNKVVDYHMLNGLLKASLDSRIRPQLTITSLPVLMSTHSIYSKSFNKNKTIFCYRNIGDTMVSYYEYSRNLKGKAKFIGDFSSFIRSDKSGIVAWCANYKSWENKATVTITYEELKTKGLATMDRVMKDLGVSNISSPVIIESLEKSSFNEVRKMELERGKDKRANETLNASFVFARKGESNQWTEKFSKEDIDFTNKVLEREGLYQHQLSK